MNFNTSKLEPVYGNLFFADFGHDVLNDYCVKISKSHFHFNLNESEGKVVPLSTLDKLINNEKILNVTILLFNKDGDVISIICLEDIMLLKIKDLNFDYSLDDIIRIRVKYKHNKMKIFDNDRELKNYQRKQKLIKINNTI